VNEIGVAVRDGVVTLTGRWILNTKKWAPEGAAHRVRGLKVVANDIEVTLPASPEPTDQELGAADARYAG
jgi:hypothetical protein